MDKSTTYDLTSTPTVVTYNKRPADGVPVTSQGGVTIALADLRHHPSSHQQQAGANEYRSYVPLLLGIVPRLQVLKRHRRDDDTDDENGDATGHVTYVAAAQVVEWVAKVQRGIAVARVRVVHLSTVTRRGAGRLSVAQSETVSHQYNYDLSSL